MARIVKICVIYLTLSSNGYILDKVKYGGCSHVPQNFILLLHHFYRSFAAFTGEQLQAVGLNFGLLFFVIYVGKHPGCSPSELTKALYLDWGYSQRSLNKLAADGFLSKEKHGRSYTLTLTDRGQQAFVVSHQVFFTWDDTRLANLNDTEKGQLLALLQKAAEGMPEHV